MGRGGSVVGSVPGVRKVAASNPNLAATYVPWTNPLRVHVTMSHRHILSVSKHSQIHHPLISYTGFPYAPRFQQSTACSSFKEINND